MKMNAIMSNVSRFAAKAKFKLGKHSPEILMAVGAVGAVTSAVMACKATLKITEIVATHQSSVATIHDAENGKVTVKMDSEITEVDTGKALTAVYVQTGLKIAKLYAPAVILGTLSLGCMVGSNRILQKRNAALTAAYVTLDKAFKDYKGRVSERFGDRVQDELERGIKAVEVENTVTHEDGTEEIVKSYEDRVDGSYSPYDLLFDEMIDEWEKDAQYNKWHLVSVENWANRRLRTDGYLFLNDVYDHIGRYNNGAKIRKPEGQIVGWIYDPNNEKLENCVKIGIDKMGDERSVLLHFNVDGPIIDKI